MADDHPLRGAPWTRPAVGATVWLHGASVGDMRALAPLISGLYRARPDLTPHITAQTAGGRAVATKLYPHARIGRPPLDLPPLPRRALARVRPHILILEYLELWPSWISACHRLDVPVVVVDGRITNASLRIAPLLARAASRITWFCAQTPQDADAACRLGVPAERVRVHGNGKYDGVPLAPPHPDSALRGAIGLVDVVIGSLHADEERAALTALAACPLRALIAPRYPKRAQSILRRARRLGVHAQRRSAGASQARWVVLDSLGELAAAYELGRVAIVGGTFGARNGQNLIEPAAHGLPVIHGPRTANIALEAQALAGKGAIGVEDFREAVEAATLINSHILEGGRWRTPTSALATLQGATQRNLDLLLPLLHKRSQPHEQAWAGKRSAPIDPIERRC